MPAELAKVRAFIGRLAPQPVCDDCIADRLALSLHAPAHHRTRELAGTDGFERRLDDCALCGTNTTVTRKAA